MNIVIEDKGNTVFKLTVTSNNDVRIKLKTSETDEMKKIMVQRLTHVASNIIKDQLNKTTLRGKCEVVDGTITMLDDSKKTSYVDMLVD